jgi:hypothetical protein
MLYLTLWYIQEKKLTLWFFSLDCGYKYLFPLFLEGNETLTTPFCLEFLYEKEEFAEGR